MARISHTNQNPSGRNMSKYPATKSDPICKWRTASIPTVIELVGYLPKVQMSKEAFRQFMEKSFGSDFFHTVYQLAAQLGLYYEDDDNYTPRFDHEITNEEALAYMTKWMKRYYVPNPYTKRGFVNIDPPINLVNAIIDYMEEHPTKPNLATAGYAIFGGEMGNIGCVKYILNNYSNVIEVDKNNDIKVLSNEGGSIQVDVKRDDKKAFFDTFK